VCTTPYPKAGEMIPKADVYISAVQITKGNWEVSDIKTVDEERNIIYYSSNETSAGNKNIYKMNFDGTNRV
jgi:hypothetical protein